jgi:transposase
MALSREVPKVIVPDNLKSGVSDAHRYEPGINSSNQDFAQPYRIVVIPARPQRPKDKAKVKKPYRRWNARFSLHCTTQPRASNSTPLSRTLKIHRKSDKIIDVVRKS